MKTIDDDLPHEFLEHIGDLHENQALNSAEIEAESPPCPSCHGARWIRMRGHRAGEPALFAQVIEAVVDVIAPCRLCGLALQ